MIVGLTGGIGSGKTTVAKLFYKLGVPIYVTDIEAKKLMVTDLGLVQKIKFLLGEQAYVDGELNRAYISDKVFLNKELLTQLNHIVHPAVALDFYKWYQQQEFNYVIKESAILFESGSYKKCDLIITVTAPIEERIKRVVARDLVTEKQVEARIKNQLSEQEKILKSHYVIYNEDLEETKRQVVKINTTILNKM
ncbi:dephospho-CoA kinase [Pseudofulvibacter geojedonensis]|uniref:Dephospho-CoA kinase n=1 Tax=Pseudofulvibacter geojedonensis TaxID=1123758 RepID=A0ABW3HZ84_9FLAO